MQRVLSKYAPYYNQLFKLGVPIMIGQLGIIVVGFADNIMVGQHGVEELAAASFVNNLFNLAFIFALGFSYGLTPIISSLVAKGNLTQAGHNLRYSLIANLILATLLAIIMGVIYLIIPLLGQPPHLLPLIRPYFLIQLCSLFFLLPFNGLKQFYDGTMETSTPMYILLTGNVINIVGNYLLIFGKCGLPELGLIGAGISTLLSRIFVLITALAVVLIHPKFARFRTGLFNPKFCWKEFKEMITIGFPIACQMGMESGAFNLSVIMMGWVGSSALAAHQIVGTFTTIGFMLYYGIGAAITILASNKRGAGNLHEVPLVANAGFHLITVIALIIMGIMWVLRNQIGLLFTDSVEVNQLVAILVIPTMIYQLSDGLQIAYANALRSLEDVHSMAVIAFISYFLICLPSAYLLGFPLGGGAAGIWWGFPIGLTVAGVLFYIRFRNTIKKGGF